MTIIVESGEGVPDANSYTSLADFRAYADLRKLTIPADDTEAEALLIRAADTMNAIKWLPGDELEHKTYPDAYLAWPRTDVWLRGRLLPSDAVPREIVYGQMALAAEIMADDANPPETAQGAVTSERVEGAVTVTYAENKGKVLPVNAQRPSAVLFADYIVKRGLFAVRA
ncbi:DnaT-like ssDNA-binding protein [Rhodanobacter lindaniclasticus]|uniref:Putative DnaT-like domain-containing protein n=1 Tax=Rhodanobacter lindaniclasticus TaxID=75310 RepID=A0A4S3KCI2_9GAMM|nr:DnaT-like ssDNA-binding protein [Rhodanobacter lindaniclasticus]THD06110.1 hypothetical protein B1991_14290 [Rhodanobacter lindaniclasticus]